MFGRIRSFSSLDSLERPPSKILKDDSLSIYETTLMKLKLGSQCDSSPPIEEDALEDDSNSSSSCIEAMNTEACCIPGNSPKDSHKLAISTKEDFMTIDSDYSTTSTTTTSTPEAFEDCQSKDYSTQPRMKNSILYLFSKFKNSPGISTIIEAAMTTRDLRCVVMSPSSSASRYTDHVELHSEQESIDSSTVLSEEVL